MERGMIGLRISALCRTTRPWVGLLLGAVLLTSCSSGATGRNTEDSFNLIVERFHTAVRWGEYQAASTYVGPTMQEDFWKIAEALQSRISIIEWQVKRSSFDRKDGAGNVVLYVSYYAKGNPQLITRTINEKWAFNAKDKMWRLVSHDLHTLGN